MNQETFSRMEEYMLSRMSDSAHDSAHVYRVLYLAMDIASYEEGADLDVLIAACLLHDIGRGEQYRTPKLDHAQLGADQALRFLSEAGFPGDYAARVAACIRTHRYRTDAPPQSLEAKILYDADKLDAAGTMGLARSLLYQGKAGTPLYTLRDDESVCDGTGDAPPSFFREYCFKLSRIYDRFFTARAALIAHSRRSAAEAFYNSLLSEARASYEPGRTLLKNHLEG